MIPEIIRGYQNVLDAEEDHNLKSHHINKFDDDNFIVITVTNAEARMQFFAMKNPKYWHGFRNSLKRLKKR